MNLPIETVVDLISDHDQIRTHALKCLTREARAVIHLTSSDEEPYDDMNLHFIGSEAVMLLRKWIESKLGTEVDIFEMLVEMSSLPESEEQSIAIFVNHDSRY